MKYLKLIMLLGLGSFFIIFLFQKIDIIVNHEYYSSINKNFNLINSSSLGIKSCKQALNIFLFYLTNTTIKFLIGYNIPQSIILKVEGSLILFSTLWYVLVISNPKLTTPGSINRILVSGSIFQFLSTVVYSIVGIYLLLRESHSRKTNSCDQKTLKPSINELV